MLRKKIIYHKFETHQGHYSIWRATDKSTNKCCKCKWQEVCKEILYYKSPVDLLRLWLSQEETIKLNLLCNLVVGPDYYPVYISPKALGEC